MTHQSMGALVEALERGGYLGRRNDPTDRRARVIVLTKKGRDLVRRAVAESADIDAVWHLASAGSSNVRPVDDFA